MPFEFVQEKLVESVADVPSLSATWDAQPAEGNLIVAIGNSQATLDELGMFNQGWTLAKSAVNVTGLYLWYKIAKQGEPLTVNVVPAVSASTALYLREYTSNSQTPFDVAANDLIEPSFTATCSTGTTALSESDDEIAIAVVARMNDTADFTVSSLTNGFTQDFIMTGQGSLATSAVVATKVLNAQDTVESTATFTGGRLAPSGLVVVFQAAQAGPVGRSLKQRYEQAPNTLDLDIANIGDGTLNWTISSDVPWLEPTPTSGTAPSTVTVKLNPAGLQPGHYTGNLTVSSVGAINTPQVVPVSVDVLAETSPVGIDLIQVYLIDPSAGGGGGGNGGGGSGGGPSLTTGWKVVIL